ncbi:MAG: ABC transporter permease, partial [Chloroflexota bacterium]
LAAPLIMTLAIGLITGTLFGDDGGGISDIPVVIVDNEEGAVLGAELMEAFKAPGREDLFLVNTSKDEDDARQRVDEAEFAAAVIIPAGFSAGIIPDYDTGIVTGEPIPIEVYTDPGQPYSAGTVISVVTQYMNVIDKLVAGGIVAVTQLRENNLIPPEETARFAEETVGRMVQQVDSQLIVLKASDMSQAEEEPLNPMFVAASGFAVFFLMFTVTMGGRSILQEREMGTLSRLMATPTRAGQILGGKTLGIFLAGFLQVTILIFATAMLLDVNWGDPLAVVALIAATAAAATGWGILLAAVATTATQVITLGGALALIFGILGGNLTMSVAETGIMASLSKITPHAWAIDGLEQLASGGDMADVMVNIAALLLMMAVLFAIAIFAFRRTQRARI